MQGCREVFGHHSRIDNIEVKCNGGTTHVNILVLAAIVPKWLLRSITEQVSPYMTSLIVPWMNIDDLVTFLSYLHEQDPQFQESGLVQLECALANLSSLFNVKELLGFQQSETMIQQPSPIEDNESLASIDNVDSVVTDFGPHSSLDDDEDSVVFSRQSPDEERNFSYLSEFDLESLDDQILTANFSDQEGRLVCLVCYKIFGAQHHSAFRNHLTAHPRAMTRRIKLKNLPKRKNKTVQVKLKNPNHRKGFSTQRNGKPKESEDNLQCDQCPFVGQNPPALKAHAKSHLEKSFQCPSCPRKFFSEKLLFNHTESGICSLEKRTCKVCDKVLSDPTRLKKHLLQHGSVKSWKCSQCPKSFTEQRSLKEHQLIHSQERRHPCPHCEKKFVQKNHLRYHLAAFHSGEVKNDVNVCKICSRTFAFPFQLKKHEACHVNKLFQHFKSKEKKSVDK